MDWYSWVGVGLALGTIIILIISCFTVASKSHKKQKKLSRKEKLDRIEYDVKCLEAYAYRDFNQDAKALKESYKDIPQEKQNELFTGGIDNVR